MADLEDIVKKGEGLSDKKVKVGGLKLSGASIMGLFALISTEELEREGQMMVKQLKNRYNDPTQNKRFVIGVDRSKMRLFDVDENDQTLTDDTPVFDNTDTGKRFEDFKL